MNLIGKEKQGKRNYLFSELRIGKSDGRKRRAKAAKGRVEGLSTVAKGFFVGTSKV